MLALPDLVACVVQLAATQGARLERSQGHRAHALFLNMIKATDPALSERLHAAALVKPWTITPLPQQARQLRSGDIYPLRVAFLQSELYLPFARAFLDQPERTLQLGEGSFSLQAIHTTSSGNPWAGVSAWSELVAQALPADELTLEFATPTAFAQGTDPWGKKRIGLLPDGESVFRSLLERWNAFSPRQMPLDLLQNVEILAKRYHLETRAILLRKHEQLGFVGRITYKISGDEEVRHLVSVLADAALYLGVGQKTTQGMGLVRRIPGVRR